MRYKLIILLSSFLVAILLLVVTCNVIVVSVSTGKCYDDIDAIPHRTFGLLLGTGRSSVPSPYYDARIQAAIDLYHAGKIDAVIISGENLYDDYYEVDSMVTTLKELGVPIKMVDPYGTDTYTSLRRIGGFGEYLNSMTIISQHFHNQRAVYYGSFLYEETPIAYNAKDTNIWYWDIWRLCRESLARTKAVLMLLFS